MTWLQCGYGPILIPDPEVERAWRSDCRPYFAVVVLLDSAELRSRLSRVAAALSGYISAPVQPHLTLHVGSDRTGSVSLGTVEPLSVDVTVGGADSFASAAFLHASSPELTRLRAGFQAELGPSEAEVDPWTPHVTVGTYSRAIATHEVARRIEGLRHLRELPVMGTVTAVEVSRQTGWLTAIP